MRAAIVLALAGAVGAVEVRDRWDGKIVSAAVADELAGTVRGTLLLPDISLPAFTEAKRLEHQTLLAEKFNTDSANVDVTARDSGNDHIDGDSVRLQYSVTGLLDVEASNRVVEEIFDGGGVFAAASLALPINGSYSVSYWSAPSSPAHAHHSSDAHGLTKLAPLGGTT